MTSEEFERWIEDTEGSVCLECGKCGVKADPDTGLCPACAAKTMPAQPEQSLSSSDVHGNET